MTGPRRRPGAGAGLRRRYGAGPGHLLAMLACFAVAAYAVSRVAQSASWPVIAVWFVAALLGHDLLLVPLYTAADRALGGTARPPTPDPGRPAGVPASWRNYIRVPIGLSALLLLVWFPLIFNLVGGEYSGSVGLSAAPYLRHWLLVSAGLCATSAASYAVRAVRARARRG